jgi:hypothetical protein
MPHEAFEFVYSVLEREDFRVLNTDSSRLTRGELVLRTLWEMETQVFNGGFDQYFWNPSGEGVPILRDALIAVQATEVLWIVDRALAVVPAEIDWKDHQSRRAVIEGLDDRAQGVLDSLDDEYYAQGDRLMELLEDFILANISEFDVGTIQ